ncbi:hypothetical protein LTR08_001748 [Meristemomyces frigidus]|nr:hypothetical protein LTR08_001748 [Meristemomyces frigidus]
MAPIPSDHHHRSTTKASNKSFKTRHASKSALKDRAKGKVESFERGVRKTPQQQVMSKIDRRNHAKQLRQNKLGEKREEGSVFVGRDGAARIVAVVPLCGDVTGQAVARELNASVDAEEQTPEQTASCRVEVPRFKQRVQYLTPARDLFACLDACRVADFVLFVLSAEAEVDELGEQMLRCIESQGVSTVLTGVHNLDSVEPAKRRPDVLKSLKSYITHFFASQDKVHDLSSRQDCSNVMRSLCTTVPKGIRWREDRSWMLLDEVRWEEAGPVVTGTIRGRGLKADRLVQVGEWGDLQIEKITAAPLESKNKRIKTNDMAVDVVEAEELLQEPGEEQDDLAELAPEEADMDDAMSIPAASLAPSERKAVLLDDHHYFNDDDRYDLDVPKRLPKGTSKYQAAWYLGDMSDSGSDMEDAEDVDGDMDLDTRSMAAGPADGHFEDMEMREPTEAGAPSEYPQSEFFPDRAPEEEAEQIAAYRQQRRDEAEEDREFPDEIELHPHVNARERLAKYRGLKSLRTSQWDLEEDRPHEPEEWSRLLEIADYKSAKNRVLKETLLGGIKAGTRVHIYLRIDVDQKTRLQSLPAPTALFSLLRHEHKHTAVNASISLASDYPAPLKSKEQLIMQCGPRRLVVNPLFSQAGNTPNNVHKFDRFLHPGRTAVASFIGPVLWGSVPCLYFRQRSAHQPGDDAIEDLAQSLHDKPAMLDLIATGTILPPSPSRIITKRIILTGHPFKMHKKLVTIRYMFFHDSDVEFFKALQLWTKRGRSGFIKETLGTHGYFKATFDGKVSPLDAVGVSLYKRVWPRTARAWVAGGDERVREQVPELVGVE